MDRQSAPEAASGGQVGDERGLPAPHGAGDIAASTIGCPLQFAMARAAQAALTQHVLYAQGEQVARPALLRSLETWVRLHGLIRGCVCPASRTEPPDLQELDAVLRATLEGVPDATREELYRLLAECATRSPADACPLERAPQASLLMPPLLKSDEPPA